MLRTQADVHAQNRRVAAQLVGRRVRSATRLMNGEPDDPIRVEWGPALLDLDGLTVLVECEESASDILLFEVPHGGGPFAEMLGRRPIRPAIATAAPGDLLRFMFDEPITAIEEVSREPPDDTTWFAMCGMRWTFGTRHRLVVGTHLTPVMIPSVAFHLPHEVDRALRYTSLRAP